MENLTMGECIHIYENSRLQAENFTPEAVTAAYVAGLAALREKAERENEKPLTKEELCQLDEEAVWCVLIDFPTINGFYCILQVMDEDELEPGEDRYFWCYNPIYLNEPLNDSDYGKEWLAYRNKPIKNSEDITPTN